MAKHIGIVACSAEGAALCYRTICIQAQKEMGEYVHPEITKIADLVTEMLEIKHPYQQGVLARKGVDY